MGVPFAFAFAAGLVATVNPCGFAMLPAYLSYFLGLDDRATPEVEGGGIVRGLLVGAVVSAGFLFVFGVAGALVSLGVRSIIDFIPWLAIVVGVFIAILGAAMVFGYEPTFTLPKLNRGADSRRLSSMFVFGVSYAIASLSCALPVFLAVVAAASATSNFVSALATFVVYGLGMSMFLVVLTLALSVGKDGLARKLKRILPYVSRVSGAVLLVVGVYITWFWISNLNNPLAAQTGTVQFVERIQTWVADQLGSRPALWAAVFGFVVIAAVGYAIWTRSRRRSTASLHLASPSTRGEDADVTGKEAAPSHRQSTM